MPMFTKKKSQENASMEGCIKLYFIVGMIIRI